MIPYKPFAQHLKDNKVIATPSELHGHASGMIVVNNDVDAEEWLELILEDYCFDTSNKSKLIPVLTALFDFAKDKIKSENYSFSALLPSDDNDLSFRLEALSTWCGAFLTGLAFAGLKSDKNMHDDVHEFIADLEKISKVDFDTEGSQGEEADFVELVEYVKAGTILLYEEFKIDLDGSELSH
jgi:uncharacterized protein YgfB (UPF0149 family)